MKKLLLSVLLLSASLAHAQRGHGYGVNHGASGNTTYSGGVYPSPGYNYTQYVPAGMTDCQFNDLKRTINQQPFDDTRMAIAKQGISANAATSTQIRDLALMLTFESNRLDLCIFAYNYCVDPNMYYVVNDVFDFSSSIDRLNTELGLAPASCTTTTVSSGGGFGTNSYYESHGGGGYYNGGYTSTGVLPGGCTTPPPAHCGTPPPPAPGGHCGSPQPVVNYYTSVPLADCDFGRMLGSIEDQWFDSSKLTVAKQIVSSNLLTSDQVRRIMELFSFESTKLDFAKYAYQFVYDPNNYYVVNSAFTFSSSVNELSRYIY